MNECARAVLIVDDDHDIREALREVLQDHGYTVLEAINGSDALALLRSAQPQPCVILLDLMMPVMDGWQFRAVQRGDPKIAEIPVVLISAHLPAEQAASGLDVSHVLRKPLELPPLLSMIAEFCGEP